MPRQGRAQRVAVIRQPRRQRTETLARCTIIGGGAERNRRTFALGLGQFTIYNLVAKGSFISEGNGGFLLFQKNIPNLYPEQKI